MAKAKNKAEDKLYAMRHSCEHVLTQAMLELFPGLKMAMGPATEEGFYFDFDYDGKISEDDFPKIEKAMRGIIRRDLPFVHEELEVKAARKVFKEDKYLKGNEYKHEWLDGIEERGEKAHIYRTGEALVDLCAGPHVKSTGEIGPLKLLSISGAYWHGDEKNKMLTRIYGTCFSTQEELDEYLWRLEEAKKRDHRKLGMDLDLFQFHDISPGAVFYHPKGATVFNELTAFLRRQYRERDYQEVVTPLVYDKSLWEQSGHWEHYHENMFILEVDGCECSLKPMNCPSHMLMFKMRTRSYRDLPLRIADFAMLHRNELRGALGGLTRVRKFSMDDAHIFVADDQLEDEVVRCIDFTRYVYELFGFEYEVVLSTRPEKSMGTNEQWSAAEKALVNALKKAKLKYELNPGDGAFYGPKIDFRIRDSLKREWQCATVQIDFQMPLRFELKYEGADGKLHTPIVIHRALLGSLERFMAILVEHYAGAFPFWLAPVQMRVLALSEKFNDYAKSVHDQLFEAGYRVDIDDSDQTLGKKIREAETSKIPVMCIVGEREMEAKSVAVRYYGEKKQEVLKVDALVKKYANTRP